MKLGPILAAVALSASVSAASAETLTLTLSGDFYQGGPAFTVAADEAEVFSGTLENESQQVFTIEIPDATKAISISFTNDAAGPRDTEGKRPPGTDRNLYIVYAEIGGQVLPGTAFTGAQGQRGTSAALFGNTSVTLDLPQIDQTIARHTADGTPVEPTKPEAAVTDTTPEVAAESRTAAAETTAAPPECDGQIAITGFGNNQATLTAAQKAMLDDAMAKAEDCAVSVVGYGSMAGSPEVNKRISGARAKAVLDYLLANGAKAAASEASGKGETDQFGAAMADNRRVVVTFN